VAPELYVNKKGGRKSTADKATEAKSKDQEENGTEGTKKRQKAPQEAYFLFSVKDNGCGMSREPS
jgi:hypothetical protein